MLKTFRVGADVPALSLKGASGTAEGTLDSSRNCAHFAKPRANVSSRPNAAGQCAPGAASFDKGGPPVPPDGQIQVAAPISWGGSFNGHSLPFPGIRLSESGYGKCLLMAPRGFAALKAARMRDALDPNTRGSRSFVRELHLYWGYSTALRLRRILVDSEIVSKTAREMEGCVEGHPIFARPLVRPSVIRSTGGRWFLFFARRSMLTSYSLTMSLPCAPWAFAAGTPLCRGRMREMGRIGGPSDRGLP